MERSKKDKRCGPPWRKVVVILCGEAEWGGRMLLRVEKANRLVQLDFDYVMGWSGQQQEVVPLSNGKCISLGRLTLRSDDVTRFAHLPWVRRGTGGHQIFFLLRVRGTSDWGVRFPTPTGET